MNKPSVARTCTRCDKPIMTAKERAYFDGKLVGTDCLLALKSERSAAAANAQPSPMGKTSGGTGLGARLAWERRCKDAEANAVLRTKRMEH